MHAAHHRNEIYIKQNELVLDDNQSGFLSDEQEPINFLSIDRIEKSYVTHNYLTRKVSDDDFEVPFVSARIMMSKNKSYSERRAYTFMDVLGDFGGFNGSITFIVSTIFASYSA